MKTFTVALRREASPVSVEAELYRTILSVNDHPCYERIEFVASGEVVAMFITSEISYVTVQKASS